MLLYLGPNIITFKVLLHLGAFIIIRPSTTCQTSAELTPH